MQSILERINSADLKALNWDELNILAKELRAFIIKTVADTGGHLAQLVIELTIAFIII